MRKSKHATRNAALCAAFAALVPAAAAASAARMDAQNFVQIERGRYLAIGRRLRRLPHAARQRPCIRRRPADRNAVRQSLSPNITPDPATGIGAWSDEQFVDACPRATDRDGTLLYPAMPYTYYTKVTKDDVLAIRAYLNTVPPVRNAVVANKLPFPFDIRASLTVWDALFFTTGEFRPRRRQTAEWNSGAYLVEGLGHCGLCHTPKNFLGGDGWVRRCRATPLQGWLAPNITGDTRRGIGGWTIDEIVAYLKTGHNSPAPRPEPWRRRSV